VANNVQTFREALMMSKAELARKAGLSTLTIDRVEAGRPCRLDTKRKILLALGFKVSDKDRVFGGLLASSTRTTGSVQGSAGSNQEIAGSAQTHGTQGEPQAHSTSSPSALEPEVLS